MSKRRVIVVGAMAAIALLSWQWRSHPQRSGTPSGPVTAGQAELERDRFGRPTVQAVLAAASAATLAQDNSPLVIEAPAAGVASVHTPKLAPHESSEASATDLARLGHRVDANYYLLSLADLRAKAASKDPQALTHLAERYLFALDGRSMDPDFEPGFAYREAGREALVQAFMLGNLHAAAMMSESLLLERRTKDAAAWNLVAQRVGDRHSVAWFLRTQEYAALSPSERNEAARMADVLWAAMEPRQVPQNVR